MKNLKLIRKKLGLTQKDVAKFLKIDQSTYSGYETGKSEPNIKILLMLSNFLDFSIDEIIGNIRQQSEIVNDNFHLLQQLDKTNNLIVKGYLLRLLEEQKRQNK